MNSRKNWRRIIPGLVISAIALVLIAYLVDLRKMIEAMKLADYRFVALVYVITLLWLLIRAEAWRTLLQNKATYSQVFFTVNEGYLLNNFLPFRLGEVARAFLLSRKANLKFFQVFSTIIIERSLDVAMSAGLLLSTLPFVIGADWALQAAIVAGCLVLIGLCMLYALARNPDWVVAQFEKLASRWPAVERVGSHQLSAFLTGLSVLTDTRLFFRTVGLIALGWVLAIAQFYVLYLAFFPKVEFLWAAFSLGVLTMGIAVPSSPGSVGVLELSMVAALSVFGLDPSISLAAALTAHLSNYVLTGLIGAYALAKDGLTLSGVYKDVREISPDSA